MMTEKDITVTINLNMDEYVNMTNMLSAANVLFLEQAEELEQYIDNPFLERKYEEYHMYEVYSRKIVNQLHAISCRKELEVVLP